MIDTQPPKFNASKLRGRLDLPSKEEFHNSPIVFDDIEDFSSIDLSQKSPKEMLKQFLMESQMDEPYIITISGNIENGASFLHRMRVELSRFRTKIVERGGVPKKFKIICNSITTNRDAACEITLTRSIKVEVVDKDLDDLLGVLSINEE